MKRIVLIVMVLIPLFAFSQNFKFSTKDTLNGKPKHEIAFSGWVWSIFNYDFVGIDSKYPALNIASVPVGDHIDDPFMNFDAFQTRLRFKSTHQTKSLGEIKLYVEGDFVSGTGAFRLRHALISVGRFDFGQTWSNMADEMCWPNVTDYDGPPTGIWPRPTMIRYHILRGEKSSLAISAEGPSLDYISGPDSPVMFDTLVFTSNQNVPDFTLRYRFDTKRVNLQVSGVYRNIRYFDGVDSTHYYKTGYGIALSSIFTLGQRQDKLYLQASLGRGISRYLVGYEGRLWDAVSSGTHDISLLPVVGGFLGYDHFWTKKKNFSSTVVFGVTNVQNDIDVYSSFDDFMLGYWAVANLWWYPVDNLSFAVEYAHAYRQDFYGKDGSAGRIQFIAMYSF
jgi:hypothetical protein